MKKQYRNFKERLFSGLSDGLIFPISHKWGINFDLREIHRNILKEKWKYVLVTWSIISVFIIGYLLHDRARIMAATYGFVQSTWEGGASSTAVATHDDDQNDYKYYYSKDSNISTSTNGEISLNYPNISIIESLASDYEQGDATGTLAVYYADDKITVSPWYDANGICGNFEVYYTDKETPTTRAGAISYCASICPTCVLPNDGEATCICNNKNVFGGNYLNDSYWTSSPYGLNFVRRIFTDCSWGTAGAASVLQVRCIRR